MLAIWLHNDVIGPLQPKITPSEISLAVVLSCLLGWWTVRSTNDDRTPKVGKYEAYRARDLALAVCKDNAGQSMLSQHGCRYSII